MPLDTPAPRAAALAAALAVSLYTGGAAPANAEALGREALSGIAEMRAGEMSKLVVHETPKPMVEARFRDADGAEIGFADFAGKVVVVNFWATWCPPCRKEMPSLDRLAAETDGTDIAVVAISNDLGGLAKPRAFFEEQGIAHLALYHDPGRKLAREVGILGLPVTLILDREGREVARLVGDAEWDSAEAKAVIGRIAELTGGGA